MRIIENSIYQESISRIAAELPVNKGSVLVTGATGLIGSCVIDVFACANKEYGSNFMVYALSRNEEFLRLRFNYSESIICLPEDVTKSINGIDPDYIVHAASNADPRSYALHPAETILINVLGAQNVLDICRNKNTRVLLTSTFEVYGKLDKDEYVEDDFGLVDQNQIRSCYPESKRTAELLFRSYFEEHGVNSVIARLASIYGPTMRKDDSKAHAQFLRNALERKDIVLKSEGTQKRTYCYVIDAVSGLLKVLFNGKIGEAYNVANDHSIATIAEVAQTIADLAGTKVTYDLPDEVESKGFSKPQNCILKADKIKSLGWDGKYSLIEGMRDTLNILQSI